MVRLPNATLAVVPERKITAYLLRPDHPEGGSKADFLERFGFAPERWTVLEAALLRHVREGRWYTRSEPPTVPSTRWKGLEVAGRETPRVLTVWLIEADEEGPRFVTLNPSRRWRSR